MAAVLSCWKEIAAFFGKGVRTVQRWEETKQLPVHRLNDHTKGTVFAYPEELHAWIRVLQQKNSNGTEIDSVKDTGRVEELQAQVAGLFSDTRFQSTE
jgi:hypothetical protein